MRPSPEESGHKSCEILLDLKSEGEGRRRVTPQQTVSKGGLLRFEAESKDSTSMLEGIIMQHEESLDIPLEVVEIIMSYLQDQEELASLRSALLVNKTFFHAAVKILYKDPFELFAVPYNIPTVVWKHRLLLFETMCKNVKPQMNPPRPYSTYIDYISLGTTLDHSDIHYSALYAARYVSDLAYKYSNHWAVEMTKRICQAYMKRAPKLNSIRVGFCPAPSIVDMLRHPNMAHVELLNQGGQKRPNGISPQELFVEISKMPNLKSLYAYGGLPRETFYPVLERKGGLEVGLRGFLTSLLIM